MSVTLNKAALPTLRDAAEGGSISVSGTATAEADFSAMEGSMVRFYAVGVDVYLSVARDGAVTAPTVGGAGSGVKIPSGEERDLWIRPMGGRARIRTIASGAGTVDYLPVS